MRRTTLEVRIQREIELALGAEPDLLLMRNSVGRATFVKADASVAHVPYGLGVGSPDLVVILDGRWFALEVKAKEGELSAEQVKVHGIWRRFGALVFVVRSVADARAALEQARKGKAA